MEPIDAVSWRLTSVAQEHPIQKVGLPQRSETGPATTTAQTIGRYPSEVFGPFGGRSTDALTAPASLLIVLDIPLMAVCAIAVPLSASIDRRSSPDNPERVEAGGVPLSAADNGSRRGIRI